MNGGKNLIISPVLNTFKHEIHFRIQQHIQTSNLPNTPGPCSLFSFSSFSRRSKDVPEYICYILPSSETSRRLYIEFYSRELFQHAGRITSSFCLIKWHFRFTHRQVKVSQRLFALTQYLMYIFNILISQCLSVPSAACEHRTCQYACHLSIFFFKYILYFLCFIFLYEGKLTNEEFH